MQQWRHLYLDTGAAGTEISRPGSVFFRTAARVYCWELATAANPDLQTKESCSEFCSRRILRVDCSLLKCNPVSLF
jgi:hypothetical protein